MAMSDCVKCWNTPCTCGWELRNLTIEALEARRELLDNATRWKKAHSNPKFSRFGDKLNTDDDVAFMKSLRLR